MSDSEGEFHSTQTVTSIDHDIYDCLKLKVGSLDRQTFEKNLLDIYKGNENEMKNVRNSLYDYARYKCSDMPEGSLSNRVQRNNGRSVAQKYASDIYLLFHYIDGSVSAQMLQQEVMSSHRRRVDRLNSTINETFVNESNEDESVMSRDTLKNMIEMKQLIQNNNKFITAQFEKLEKRQEVEIKSLKQQLTTKEREIASLNSEVQSCRDREIELSAENKLLRQEVNSFKLELEHQSSLRANKKDNDKKFRSLESKIQNICNRLKSNENKAPTVEELTVVENNENDNYAPNLQNESSNSDRGSCENREENEENDVSSISNDKQHNYESPETDEGQNDSSRNVLYSDIARTSSSITRQQNMRHGTVEKSYDVSNNEDVILRA
ncbi:hypothetical protein FSP39_016758 [Pinctada imbricata]|uniref:Uncharacterized protein n=1 Tax=Pinctada imbricata TaxID=66713 RepID=A0AA88XW07_PINIB|nr:hypothetical protein FSP39_016758 [Pinctada imbricata]